MKSFVALALAASALAAPAPQSEAPEGCQSSRDGTFEISVVNVTTTAKRSLLKRQLDGILTLTLQDGVLKDQADRTGSVVANHQFQFDNPTQENALKTSGFSVCANGSLALDGSAIWYQCLSGEFHNLYDESQGEQCNAIYLVASGSGPVSQISDGQPAATTQVSPISEISDGQPQAPTGAPVSQIPDGQPQAPTGAPVTQIPDGQLQAPTGAPVSQIPDGQPQAPAGPVVSQISDGQPQAPTEKPAGPVVSQISDGQPQAPVPTAAPPVTQISDGQPQAPVATGNFTAPNATIPPQEEFTGAGATPTMAAGALAAGLLALFAML